MRRDICRRMARGKLKAERIVRGMLVLTWCTFSVPRKGFVRLCQRSLDF
jgi:hypothetical protein